MRGEPEDVIRELAEQFRPIMDRSPDGVYLWLDEAHKTCNMIPISYRGYAVAYHFVRHVGE